MLKGDCVLYSRWEFYWKISQRIVSEYTSKTMLSATYPCMCAQYLHCVCQTAAYGDVIPGDFMVNTHPGTGTGTETGTFLSFTVNPKTLAVSCNSRETHTPTPGTSLKPVSLSPSPDTITPTLTGEAFVLHTIGEMGLIPGRQG